MSKPLAGIRILEVAQFAPNAVGMHLADLGAEVIKVETLGLGDPARLLGKPIEGEAPATRRWNRGKQSVALDLRQAEGAEVFRALVKEVDAVVEGMRPGSLARRGLGYEALLGSNPRLVFISVSGWGEEGPYRDLGSHGLAFDAYAGLAPPRPDLDRPTRPSGHVWQGLEAAPLYGALALVFLLLAVRYASLWLGGVMLFQAIQFSLQAWYFVTGRAHDVLYVIINNIDFFGILACLTAGTLAASRRRREAQARVNSPLGETI